MSLTHLYALHRLVYLESDFEAVLVSNWKKSKEIWLLVDMIYIIW